ncbi:MAG: DNA polymerase, partial [Sediminibacterium sp.]
ILPDTGKQLLYIDYSQFEAGILASLADDDRLIALYNSDIYADIAQNILKDKTKRDQAKIIFYRFMYGDGSLSEEIQNYFNRFPKLKSFRQQIDASVEKDKKIGTSKGNFRLAGEKDNGWALSHKIQATASLIYKSALIRVKNEVPSAGFLIPMHDATLYQIDKYLYDDAAKAVKELYEEEFKAYCPKINPKVTMSMTF